MGRYSHWSKLPFLYVLSSKISLNIDHTQLLLLTGWSYGGSWLCCVLPGCDSQTVQAVRTHRGSIRRSSGPRWRINNQKSCDDWQNGRRAVWFPCGSNLNFRPVCMLAAADGSPDLTTELVNSTSPDSLNKCAIFRVAAFRETH